MINTIDIIKAGNMRELARPLAEKRELEAEISSMKWEAALKEQKEKDISIIIKYLMLQIEENAKNGYYSLRELISDNSEIWHNRIYCLPSIEELLEKAGYNIVKKDYSASWYHQSGKWAQLTISWK